MTYFNTFFDKKFCFIRGSFAETAPLLRLPDSDIDIVCSENFSEEEIKRLLKQKYPQLPVNVKLDIKRRTPKNNTIYFKHSYWSTGPYIELSNSRLWGVNVKNIALPMDFLNCLRDPNKQCFKSYIRMTNKINISPVTSKGATPEGYINSIERHYGTKTYEDAIKDIPEEKLLRALYKKRWVLNKQCQNDYKKIVLMPQFKVVIGNNNNNNNHVTYEQFYQKCLSEQIRITPSHQTSR